MTAIEFLRRYRPGALEKSSARGEYQLVAHDSFKINGESSVWHWKSHNIGGRSALNYLIYVENTLEQLEAHRQDLHTKIGQLLTKRKQLPKTVEADAQREQISNVLRQLRQEERLCRKIAEHSIEVQQHLTEARRDRAEQQLREKERERDHRPIIDFSI